MLAKPDQPLRCQTSLQLILLVPLHPVLVLSCFSLLSSRHLCPFWPLLNLGVNNGSSSGRVFPLVGREKPGNWKKQPYRRQSNYLDYNNYPSAHRKELHLITCRLLMMIFSGICYDVSTSILRGC